MFFTARQLQEMHKAHGQVILPYRASLTPLARDWVRQHGIAVGYGTAATETDPAAASGQPNATAQYLWWCDGPCGPAKAAVTALEREGGIAPLPLPPVPMPGDNGPLIEAIRQLAGSVKSGKAAGGVLLVKSAGAAVVYANRCPTLRAIVGTCRGSVEDGLRTVAANVLVIEHPWQTLMQIRNMIALFVRAKRDMNARVQSNLTGLASCA